MITSKQIELVQQSWQIIVSRDMQTTGRIFYNCLFELAPEVKPMFRRASVNEQSAKFLSMINYFIMNLNNPQDAVGAISILAKQHVTYGVQEEQYTLIGRALLWTLQTTFTDKWNNELKQAWIIAYTMLAEAMMKAAKQHEQANERVY